MWKMFLLIDYWGMIRKDWEYVVQAREWLKTLPILKSFPNFMWYLITWYSLILPQAIIASAVVMKLYQLVKTNTYLEPDSVRNRTSKRIIAVSFLVKTM